MEISFNYINWLQNNSVYVKKYNKKIQHLTNDIIKHSIKVMSNIKYIDFIKMNGKYVPKNINMNVITYLINFQKYKVPFMFARINRLANLHNENPHNMKKNTLYLYTLKFGKEQGLAKYKNKCVASTITQDLYIKKYGQDLGKKLYHDAYKVRGLPFFIKKYGQIQGNKRYLAFCQRNKGNKSKQRMIQLYGEKQGIKRYNQILNHDLNQGTLQYCQNKFGLIQGQKFFNYKMQRLHFGSSLAGFIQKYGQEQGIIQCRKAKANCTIDRFVQKYGQQEGRIKFNQYLEKLQNTKFFRVSAASIQFFYPIYLSLLDIGFKDDDIYFGGVENKKQYKISYYNQKYKRNSNYFYDFTILSKRIIIEYNGSYYHPKNDNKLQIQQWNANNKDDGNLILQRDIDKKNKALENNFSYLIIWDDQQKLQNIKKIINFLKNNGIQLNENKLNQYYNTVLFQKRQNYIYRRIR